MPSKTLMTMLMIILRILKNKMEAWETDPDAWKINQDPTPPELSKIELYNRQSKPISNISEFFGLRPLVSIQIIPSIFQITLKNRFDLQHYQYVNDKLIAHLIDDKEIFQYSKSRNMWIKI